MHARAFPLTRTTPKRLLVTWDTGSRNVRVYFDGNRVESVVPGLPTRLPDGGLLEIGFNWLGQPRVTYNDRSLPGSADDPVSRIPVAAGTCFLFGFLWAIGGLYDILLPMAGGGASGGAVRLNQAGRGLIDPIALIYLVAGLVVIGCGVLIALRKRIGTWIALTLIGIDTVLLVITLLRWGNGDPLFSLALHALALFLIYRSFAGFDTLQAEAAEALMLHQARPMPAPTPLREYFVFSLPESVGVMPVPPADPPAPAVPTFTDLPSVDAHLLGKIEGCIRANDPTQAKALLRDFMQRYPANGYAWYLASLLLIEKPRQIAALRRALQYSPELVIAQERLAVLEATS